MGSHEWIARPSEYWALCRRTDRTNTKLAIFIHGYWGDFLTTWGALPGLLRQNAYATAKGYEAFADWDYLFLGYDTGDMESYLDIAAIIATQWTKAGCGERPFGAAYATLSLFGHSLGTLGIRQLLYVTCRQPDGMLQALKSVTLFGTPIKGSSLAVVGSLFNRIGGALRPANPELRMLKVWGESIWEHQPWPRVRVILGTDDRVVGNNYAELISWAGDAKPELATFDHSSIVKPKSWTESSIVGYIHSALQ